MKFKEKPGSKIPTTKTNTNKKRISDVGDGEKKLDGSLLKKNEVALIILGALILIIIIFFFFFRSSNSKIDPAPKILSSTSFVDFEKRIEKIEQALQLKEKQTPSAVNQSIVKKKSAKDVPGIDPLEERVTRLETAFSVKFDSLIERMVKIEKSILRLKNKPVATLTPKPVVKHVIPVKKAVKKEKKASMFHTVQKGETLYSISKKYNTSIASLRKLNNLSTNAKIYPGNNILIR
ncbi:MAG: LysM peptidoglycan-binding domain-containing protein [Desulfobacula sp.]|nr:LysM peptidoglycan-binding domain-containing protein [Desulfobacula sp.]